MEKGTRDTRAPRPGSGAAAAVEPDEQEYSSLRKGMGMGMGISGICALACMRLDVDKSRRRSPYPTCSEPEHAVGRRGGNMTTSSQVPRLFLPGLLREMRLPLSRVPGADEVTRLAHNTRRHRHTQTPHPMHRERWLHISDPA